MEFHQRGPGRPWRPFPVEHKRGRPKHGDWDRVQLCAQGICLEEIFGVAVPAGALFYGATRRRQDVIFDEDLRYATEDAARRFHELVDSGRTPKAAYAPEKCDACSLLPLCLPRMAARGSSVGTYLAQALTKDLGGE